MFHRRRELLEKLLRPISPSLDDNAELISLHIAIGCHCKRVPLKLGNARHANKQDTCGIVIQSCDAKLHACMLNSEKKKRKKMLYIYIYIYIYMYVCMYVCKLLIVSVLPGLLEKLSSRVSQGKRRAESNLALSLDCRNLKNRSTRNRKMPGRIIQK
jgi:hypothetical protein